MLGRKTFAPKLFYQLSLEERVSEDYLLRRVAAAVDFGFVRRLTARFSRLTGQRGSTRPRTVASSRSGGLIVFRFDGRAGSPTQPISAAC